MRARDACSPRTVDGRESPRPALCQPNQKVRSYSAPSNASVYDPAQAPPALWYCPAALEERERRALAAYHMELKSLGEVETEFMPKLDTVFGFTCGPQAAGIIGIPGWEGVIASSRYNDTKPPSLPTVGEVCSACERRPQRRWTRNADGTKCGALREAQSTEASAEQLALHPCVLLDEVLAARMAKARKSLYSAHTNVRKLYDDSAHGASDTSRPGLHSGGCAKSENPSAVASPRPLASPVDSLMREYRIAAAPARVEKVQLVGERRRPFRTTLDDMRFMGQSDRR